MDDQKNQQPVETQPAQGQTVPSEVVPPKKGKNNTILILALIFLLVFVGTGVYFLANRAKIADEDMEPELELTEELAKELESMMEPQEQFDLLEENENTPSEITNEVLDELDGIMNSIDGSAEETLSDL